MPPSHAIEIVSLVFNNIQTRTPALIRLHIYTRRCGQRTHPNQVEISRSFALPVLPALIDPSAQEKVIVSGKIPSCPGHNPIGILDHLFSGSLHRALELCEGNVETDGFTFVALLKACVKLKDLDACKRIGTLLDRQGLLGKNVFVSGSLIHAYVRCGCLIKARDLFEKLPVRNIVVWTVMVSGLVEYGLNKEALLYYHRMQEHVMCMDVGIFVCVLKACAGIGAMTSDGYAIHYEVVGRGLDSQYQPVSNCLIDMYAKCGLLCEAQILFETLASRDVVSWNALIGGYVEHGFQEKAFHCLDKMQEEGVYPSAVTVVCVLKACGGMKAINKAQVIHIGIIQKGILETDAFIGSALVDVYAKCMLFKESRKVFEALPVKDVVSWNALISGYINQRWGEEVILCFEQMQSANVIPNIITFTFIVKACTMTGALEKGQGIHAQIIDKGYESEVVIRTSLVNMYCTFGIFHKAEELLSKFRDQNTIVCLNALISGYEIHGHHKKAMMCFKKILFDSIVPDKATFTSGLKACGSLGCLIEGQRIHSHVVLRGLENDLLAGSTLVVMYMKCGSPDEARAIFGKLSVRNVVSWTALITGHAQLLEEREHVFHSFESMIGEGVQPDLVAFLSLLSVCNHVGLVEKGCTYFGSIYKDEYDVMPMLEHFTCVVGILGRAGNIEEVVSMIQNMPFHPSTVSWHTLLGACQSLCNSKLAEYAFENSLVLNESDCTAYVSLSNIYTKCL